MVLPLEEHYSSRRNGPIRGTYVLKLQSYSISEELLYLQGAVRQHSDISPGIVGPCEAADVYV